MEISSIGLKSKFFSHSAAKADFKSQKDRLLLNHLVQKDRVTISPEARTPILQPPPANPGPIQSHLGIGPPEYIHPGDDFTIPEEILEALKQAMADKLSVPVEDITIVDQKEVSWSDTSLGNPQPGHYYAQMIVEGYKITAQAGEDKQAREFYAAMGRIIGPDPFSGQPPVVMEPE